jgi:hypothetical protein
MAWMLGFAVLNPTYEILFFRDFWNGIVAAGMEGVASANSHGSEITTSQCAETIDRVEGVLGASGGKATARRK